MTKLEQARIYEKEHSSGIREEERPLFHISPAVGWLNDPNGFSVYKGEYHLFYQYHPYDTHWGPMHWGHYKTRDFIHWEMLPAALAPDEDYETGCFSGGAVEMEDGRQLLMYTGHYEEDLGYGKRKIVETQCVAVGDGVNYEKYDQNPVLTAADLPEGGYPNDFRDPKIWKEQDGYYAVCVNRADDGNGAILLFRSENGFKWEFVCTMAECRGEYGGMWECPDFFTLDEKGIIIVSPMNMLAKGLEFHSGHGVIAMIGNCDKETHEFDREYVQAIDYGLDFYAPQTLETLDGRRVMIGWMQSWVASAHQPEGRKWHCMMTIPRELEIRDGRLIQNPVRELMECQRNRVVHEGVVISAEEELPGVEGRTIDMTVTIDTEQSKGCSELVMKLAADGNYFTRVTYSYAKDTVTVDRTFSGVRHDLVNVRSMQIGRKEGIVKLRFLVDRFSIELFANDGEQAFSLCLYETPMEARKISFESDGEAVLGVEKYEIVK